MTALAPRDDTAASMQSHNDRAVIVGTHTARHRNIARRHTGVAAMTQKKQICLKLKENVQNRQAEGTETKEHLRHWFLESQRMGSEDDRVRKRGAGANCFQ